MNPEELQTHAGFIRSLARSLVLDDSRAADVVQQTWMAAIEHPPAEGKPLRSWLAKVARNFARLSFRVDERRLRRERAAALPERLPSAEEIARKEEARRRLVDALFGLKEPYRTTILLRYYEDLQPRDVARRLGVPVETVRTRLKRGLAQLRTRLDAAYGSDRKSWCLAVAPLAGTMAAAGTKMKAAIAAAAALTAMLTLWQVWPEKPEDQQPGFTAVAEEIGRPGKISPPRIAQQPPGPPRQAENNVQKQLIEPTGFFAAGRVRDKATGEPVTAFWIKVTGVTGKELTTRGGETVGDSEGRFRLSVEKGDLFGIRVCSSQYRERVVVCDEEELHDLQIDMDPGLSVSGRVVDHATGRPEAGVLIGTARESETDLAMLLSGLNESCPYTVTDEKGRFTLRGLKEEWQTIAAVHPGFAEGAASAFPGAGDEIEIRLQRGTRIFGTAFNDNGEPLPGLLIRMHGNGIPLPRPLLTGPDGSFRTEPALPGKVTLSAEPPPGETEASFRFQRETKVVELVDREIEVVFGSAGGYITWRGTVRDGKGRPVQDGTISAIPEEWGEKSDPDPVPHRTATIEDQGRFQMEKLEPGRYSIRLKLSRSANTIVCQDVSFDNPGLKTRDIVLPEAAISGTIVDAATGRPMTGERCRIKAALRNRLEAPPLFLESYTASINGEGRFSLTSLVPGTYSLSVYQERTATSIPDFPEIRIRDVTVEAAEKVSLLRLDFPARGRVVIRGAGFDPSQKKSFAFAVKNETGEELFRRME